MNSNKEIYNDIASYFTKGNKMFINYSRIANDASKGTMIDEIIRYCNDRQMQVTPHMIEFRNYCFIVHTNNIKQTNLTVNYNVVFENHTQPTQTQIDCIIYGANRISDQLHRCYNIDVSISEVLEKMAMHEKYFVYTFDESAILIPWLDIIKGVHMRII